jgi:hypothetical protein
VSGPCLIQFLVNLGTLRCQAPPLCVLASSDPVLAPGWLLELSPGVISTVFQLITTESDKCLREEKATTTNCGRFAMC